MLNFLGKQDLSEGYYFLLKKYENKLIVEFSSVNKPSSVYAVTFKGLETAANLDELLQKDNIDVQLLEEVKLDSSKNEIC